MPESSQDLKQGLGLGMAWEKLAKQGSERNGFSLVSWCSVKHLDLAGSCLATNAAHQGDQTVIRAAKAKESFISELTHIRAIFLMKFLGEVPHMTNQTTFRNIKTRHTGC